MEFTGTYNWSKTCIYIYTHKHRPLESITIHSQLDRFSQPEVPRIKKNPLDRENQSKQMSNIHGWNHSIQDNTAVVSYHTGREPASTTNWDPQTESTGYVQSHGQLQSTLDIQSQLPDGIIQNNNHKNQYRVYWTPIVRASLTYITLASQYLGITAWPKWPAQQSQNRTPGSQLDTELKIAARPHRQSQ